MLETLQIINFIITMITGVFALIVTISKPFRKWFFGAKAERKRIAEEEEARKETDRCLLRDRILSIYYKNSHECEIKLYEFENVERLYRQYKKLGGNSFVDKVWMEMQDWRVNQ